VKHTVEGLLDLHRAFWRMEDLTECLVNFERERVERRAYMWGPPEAVPKLSELQLADGRIASEGLVLEPWMLSPTKAHPLGLLMKKAKRKVANLGETFQTFPPYFKIPWIEAVAGCKLEVAAKSDCVWSRHYLNRNWYEKEDSLRLNEEWTRKLLEFTHYLEQELHGSIPVVQTLMRGPCDMLSAIMGVEEMCMSMATHPTETQELLRLLTDLFIRVASAQVEAVPRFRGGYCNSFGLWAPGTSIRTQDDQSVSLNPRLYEKFILPFQKNIAQNFDYSVMHLHTGAGLRILDMFLHAEEVSAINVTFDPPPWGPSVEELIPILKKIQTRKPLIFDGSFTDDELSRILEQLSPRGLLVFVHSLTPRIDQFGTYKQ